MYLACDRNQADAPQAPHLASCCLARDDATRAHAAPEERIEAPDGEGAAVFDVATFLRAGQSMAPQLGALHCLWEAKRAAAPMPSRRDFTVEELGPWLGHLMLVDAIEAGRDYVYRVFGTRIADFFGHDLTGKRLSTLTPQVQRAVGEEYGGVLATQRPRYVVGSPFLWRRSAMVARVILPLSHAGSAVDQLLIGFYPIGART
jgi:hypothetical protein